MIGKTRQTTGEADSALGDAIPLQTLDCRLPPDQMHRGVAFPS